MKKFMNDIEIEVLRFLKDWKKFSKRPSFLDDEIEKVIETIEIMRSSIKKLSKENKSKMNFVNSKLYMDFIKFVSEDYDLNTSGYLRSKGKKVDFNNSYYIRNKHSRIFGYFNKKKRIDSFILSVLSEYNKHKEIQKKNNLVADNTGDVIYLNETYHFIAEENDVIFYYKHDAYNKIIAQELWEDLPKKIGKFFKNNRKYTLSYLLELVDSYDRRTKYQQSFYEYFKQL